MSRAEWNNVRVVLLDIEGTTTPIDFVYKTLFPYASRNVESFLAARIDEPAISAVIADLKAEHAKDAAAGLKPPNRSGDPKNELQECVAYIHWLMARDSKCIPLKLLQGKIWQVGFETGELHGEVYDDVPRAFTRWRRQGREVAIYSSGSVLAQKMLFSSVLTGDLACDIRAFFDTAVGMKTEASSYLRIARELQLPPAEVLFLSDAPKEIDAARFAGVHTVLCTRSSRAESAGADQVIRTFDEVLPD